VWHRPECSVDVVQRATVPQDGEAVDGVAWLDRCVDHSSHESGAV